MHMGQISLIVGSTHPYNSVIYFFLEVAIMILQ
jgi:hypothetical protein